MPPRFSVVIPVRDRAGSVGRAVAAALTQTFGDLEVVVVDDGSTDDSADAARSTGDDRLRVVHQEPAGAAAACRAGLLAATGSWAVLLDADTEVSAGWLARLGRLADGTGATFVTCGGEHHHLDGSRTRIEPTSTACLRPGAFATGRELLLHAADRAAATGPATDGGAEALDTVRAISELGRAALVSVLAEGPSVVQTPERLVLWHDPVGDDTPAGDELRLRWAWQVLDALSRTPIPDGDLLARAATVGGEAANRLGRHEHSRLLFGIACRAQPGVGRHWARWAVSCVPPLSRRVAARDVAAVAG